LKKYWSVLMRKRKISLQIIFCALAVIIFTGCGVFTKRLPSGSILNKTPGAVDYMVKIDGVAYHYAEYGKGKKHVVMLHGFGSSTYSWEKVAPVLQKGGYHIWTLDMKGFGWSDKPDDAKYDPYSLMEDVNAWMEKMKLSKVAFAGNSLGGAIAVLLALEHPDKIDRLILVDAGGYPMDKPGIIKMASIPFSAESVGCLYGQWIVEWNLKEVYSDKNKIEKKQVRAYYDRMRTRGHIDSQVSLSRSLNFNDFKKYIARIRQLDFKTLIIWGEDDAWISLKNVGYRFRSDMKNSKLVVIPRCGHIPQEEKPGVTARYMLDFLDGSPIEEATWKPWKEK